MKDRRNAGSGSFDETSQYNSDSNSSGDNSQHSNASSSSGGAPLLENPPDDGSDLVAGLDDGVPGDLNKQPKTLDLSINTSSASLCNVLARRVFASFDSIGVHSGVPTRTTSTLTPTTLKNIEQSFMEASNDTHINLPYQAGFVPPPYPIEEPIQDEGVSQESLSSTSSWHVSASHDYTADDLDSKSSASLDPIPSTSRGRRSATRAATPASKVRDSDVAVGSAFAVGSASGSHGAGSRRNVGGRRPHKSSNMSPEEEEKRRIRRERNKQAAARCRRRREDHTNELVDETDQLEKRRQSLQQEIVQLQQQKDDLEFLLDSHREHCRLQVRRRSIELKPEAQVLEPAAPFVLPKIKTEPEEDYAYQQPAPHEPQQPGQLQQQHLADGNQQLFTSSRPQSRGFIGKKLKLSNTYSDSLDTPTPNAGFVPLPAVNSKLTHSLSGRPIRPDSLDVKAAAQYPLLNRLDAAGAVGHSTPSSGLFNFESLMEGGTGLTPIAAPISFPPNRNPLEMITPTSTEPSKLCSL